MTRTFLALTAAIAMASSADAAMVVVTPGDVATTPALNQWYRTNFRDVSTGFTSTTAAAVTSSQPRSGNGSVEMSLTDASGKVDYAYTWGYVPGRTIGNLTTLGFDWFRDGSSSNSAKQAPALRLLFDADGSESTTSDRGYLIWEQTNQGTGFPDVATDVWVSSNAVTGEFWQRRFSPGTTIEDYDIDLAEWAAGANPAGALVLSGASAILGIEFGIGSGWGGNFLGYVDNVRYGFGTAESTTFNFETTAATVAEPASLALVGLSLLGMAATRRRRP